MTTALNSDIAELEAQILDLKKKLSDARRRSPGERVPDLALVARDGSPKRLSDFFQGRADLLAVHNMGKRCVYCTLWADGFVGVWPHLNDRTAFVLVSEDDPATLDEFAHSRGWPFPVASMKGTDFAKALGVAHEDVHQQPGVSAFRRNADGTITRTGHAPFGPGDDFCSVWPLLDLLDGGAKEWAPKYSYAAGSRSCCGGH